MHGYFVVHRVLAGKSTTEEAIPSSIFVENGSATWFSAKISLQGLVHKIGFDCYGGNRDMDPLLNMYFHVTYSTFNASHDLARNFLSVLSSMTPLHVAFS